jgi:mono/diheme cytochrome c family protein
VGGKTVTVEGQTWEFPSESQCLQCHTAAAGRTLGLEIGQLNGDFGYPTGRTANQLATLNAIDTLTPPLSEPPAQLPVIPDPFGSAAVGERARAWLHTNCANCHRPGGGAQSDMDLRYTTALSATNACDVAPTLGDLGVTPDPRLIAPGSAARSVVVARVDRTGTGAMPPLARHQIDTQGVQLLTQWIDALSSCN